MCANEQSISVINGKILAGEAKVYTEMELRDLMETGTDLMCLGVDLVTTAFRSSISGSAAMLLVPVTGRGIFTRAKKIWLNRVPGYPGPAPNERLGVVDTLIFTDQVCDDAEGDHTGAKLLVDVLNDDVIQVECLSVEGTTYHSSFSLKTLQFARMVTYNTFIPLSRINDGDDANGANEHLRTIRVGNKVLLNKASGIVVGCGTRGSSGKNSLSLSADMFEMDPKCLVQTDGGVDSPVAHSVALTIPVLNVAVLESVTAYLGRMEPGENNRYFHESDEEMAAYLKELVLKREFMPADSDAEALCA